MQWLWFFWVPKIFLCNFWYVWLPSQPHQSKSPAKKSDSGTILIKAVPWLLHESTDSTKINRPGYNICTYVLNKFSTADCSIRTKYFWKNSNRSFYSIYLRFFWHTAYCLFWLNLYLSIFKHVSKTHCASNN